MATMDRRKRAKKVYYTYVTHLVFQMIESELSEEKGHTLTVPSLMEPGQSSPVVSKVCSANPKGSATGSPGIHGSTSVIATWKFTSF